MSLTTFTTIFVARKDFREGLGLRLLFLPVTNPRPKMDGFTKAG